MSGAEPDRLLDHFEAVMSQRYDIECRLQQRYHALQHERMIVGPQTLIRAITYLTRQRF